MVSEQSNSLDPKIQRSQNLETELPAALMTAQMIREIHATVPEMLRQHIIWTADASDGKRLRSDDVDAFLDAILNEPRVERIYMYAHIYVSGYNGVDLHCGTNYASIKCAFEQQNETEFSIFTNFIRGIFNEHRRRFSKVPSSLLASEEANRPTFLSSLNRQRIIEDIISRGLTYLLILGVGGLVGYLINQIT